MLVTKVYANTLAQMNAHRLDGERLHRVAEAATVADALKMLGDYGFCIADGSIDGFITAETDALIRFIYENAASESVKRALLAPFVYNNVKLAYKSRFTDIPEDAYYGVELDTDKIAAGDYDELDKDLAEALTALDEAGEKRPQVIDAVITRAMYRRALSCRAAVVRKYFRTEIDLKNLLTAARMKKLNITRDEFIEGGYIKTDRFREAISEDDLSLCYAGTRYEETGEALERTEFRELGAFERDSDDMLFYLTDSMCANMSAYEPFLNYYTRARIELKTIKTALVCVKSNSRDSFYARIPKIYA